MQVKYIYEYLEAFDVSPDWYVNTCCLQKKFKYEGHFELRKPEAKGTIYFNENLQLFSQIL